jgi:hypothetical protein
MPGDFIEFAPLLDIFLCLSGVLLFLHPRMVLLRLSIFDMSFVLRVGASLSWIFLCGVPRPKLSRLLFEILLDFDGILVGHTQG